MRSPVVKPLAIAAIALASMAPMSEGSDQMARAETKAAKGEAALQRQEYDDAERSFRKAIELYPALPSAHLGLGAALVGQRRYAEALDALASAERAYAEYQSRQQEAGRVAVERMKESRRQVETLEDTYHVFHQVPTTLGLPENVIGVVNVDDRNDVPPQLSYLQGVSYLRTGESLDGIERLERTLELDPDHALANYNLAVALHSVGRSLEARAHLEAARAGGVEPAAGLVEQIAAASDVMMAAKASEPD